MFLSRYLEAIRTIPNESPTPTTVTLWHLKRPTESACFEFGLWNHFYELFLPDSDFSLLDAVPFVLYLGVVPVELPLPIFIATPFGQYSEKLILVIHTVELFAAVFHDIPSNFWFDLVPDCGCTSISFVSLFLPLLFLL
jgi:hypothetical protein